jgi:DNA primase
VLVEGPLDALAITTATHAGHLGLAPLGTALTDEQAHQLATLTHASGTAPVVAADADPAGARATERAYWLLAQHGLTPRSVTWQAGSDPADTLARTGAEALRQLLEASSPLTQLLLTDHLAQDVAGLEALRRAAALVAAGPPDGWDAGTQQVADAMNLPLPVVRRELAQALRDRAHDPRAVTLAQSRPRPPARQAAAPPPEVVSRPPAAARTPEPTRSLGPSR